MSILSVVYLSASQFVFSAFLYMVVFLVTVVLVSYYHTIARE